MKLNRQQRAMLYRLFYEEDSIVLKKTERPTGEALAVKGLAELEFPVLRITDDGLRVARRIFSPQEREPGAPENLIPGGERKGKTFP